MKSNAIVNAMFSSFWHVSHSSVEGLHQIAQLYLNGKFNQAEKPEQFFKIENATDFADSNKYDNVPVLLDNGVLVFPILGTIMQSDYCWSAGTETMTQWIKSAQDDKRVKSILLYVNSGGGQSAGTWEFANAIAEVTKPKMALGKGTVGSAAYYIAAAADIIYVTSPDVIVGSIGTMLTYRKSNDSYQYIYADTSGQKHGGSRAMDANNDSSVIRDNILNPLDKNFMDFVSAHRPQLSADALDGLEVAASKSLELNSGLIDGIMSYEEAIAYLVLQTQSSNTMSQPVKKVKLLMTERAHAIISKVPGIEVTQVTEEMEAEELQQALLAKEVSEQKVIDLEQSITQLKGEVSQKASADAKVIELQNNLTAEQTKVTDLQAKVSEKDTEIENLKQQLQAAGTPPKPNTEEEDPIDNSIKNPDSSSQTLKTKPMNFGKKK